MLDANDINFYFDSISYALEKVNVEYNKEIFIKMIHILAILINEKNEIIQNDTLHIIAHFINIGKVDVLLKDLEQFPNDYIVNILEYMITNYKDEDDTHFNNMCHSRLELLLRNIKKDQRV